MEDLNFLHDQFDQSKSSTGAPQIVLVEDDKILGMSIQRFLQKNLKAEVHFFTSSSDCLENLSLDQFSSPFCLITDISLGPGADGLLLIDILKERGFKFTAIAMTGFACVETAISATKKGVFHYLTKPFELEKLHDLILDVYSKKFGTALDFEHFYGEEKIPTDIRVDVNESSFPKYKIQSPKEEDIFCGIIGRSSKMKEVYERIEKVAASDSTVLITGPSGAGKELVAKAIHDLSIRKQESKISVNCGAIPSELLESELFGHMKGAFTGAISNRKGRFELAHGGTIFLDEIGDMPLLLQVKLLRVLQSRQIEPVGGMAPMDIDVRVITATHRNLEQLVADGTFREDLFYRLNVIPIVVPALKERREDIPLLISYFLSRFVSADGSNGIEFTNEALELLLTYDWPGNVRELENVIERLVILRGGNLVKPEDLPAKIFRNNPLATSLYKTIFELPEEGVNLKKILSEIEESLILQAMTRTSGNKNKASKLLSLNRTTLIEKMKKKQITI